MEDKRGKGMELRSLPPDQYTVGWICALPIAAKAMLDEVHSPINSQTKADENNYALGSIGRHNVTLTCFTEYGVVSAAVAAISMQNTFPRLRFGRHRGRDPQPGE
jgi:hypothetical protein